MLCGVENVLEAVVIFDPNNQAINIITIPEDSMSNYSYQPGIITIADNEGGLLPIYLGYAISILGGDLAIMETQPLWQISKLTYDINGAFQSQAWANGGANRLIWNDRTSYDYS